MNSKLNLSIDEQVKDRIKKYAAIRNISLSIIVENHFKALLASSEEQVLNSPLTDSLAGILKGVTDEEAAAVRMEYLEAKYLNE